MYYVHLCTYGKGVISLISLATSIIFHYMYFVCMSNAFVLNEFEDGT